MKRGRVTARKCVEKRRRATCKARKNEKLRVARYLAKKKHEKKHEKKNVASVLESRNGAAALTRCKHEALGDGLLLFSTERFILNKVDASVCRRVRI